VAGDGSVCGDFGGFELVEEKDLHRDCGEHRVQGDSEGEEILKKLFARCGEDGFWVELDTLDFVAAVAEAHDDAVVGFGGDG